jgi:hypothetical protein
MKANSISSMLIIAIKRPYASRYSAHKKRPIPLPMKWKQPVFSFISLHDNGFLGVCFCLSAETRQMFAENIKEEIPVKNDLGKTIFVLNKVVLNRR